jgi:predicted ATPase/DNA-binding SARP family transcriptional activator
MLALYDGRVVDHDTLAEGVFGDDPPARPRHAIATLVLRLRDRLGPGIVVTTDGGYRLDLSSVTIDANLFEQAVRSGAGLAEAIELWRGRPYVELEGWPPAEVARVRLEGLRDHAEEEVAAAGLRAGAAGAVVGELEALVAAAPFRERRWVLLIDGLYAAGRQADALAAYQRARTLLAEELGIEPGPDLVAAERAVLTHDASITAGSLPVAGNLPLPDAGLIGRDAEMTQVAVEVLNHGVVTLTGPGGVGKTVLAIAAGGALRAEFHDGVWLVELAAAARGEDVAATVATALGVRAQTGMTAESTLRVALSNQALLVVLDNCDYVLEAARRLVRALRGGCPRLRILATCRERLNVADEYDIPVRPLRVGGPGSPAFELLVARSHRRNLAADKAERDAVVEICERVDGLPLALELAGGRCRAMRPTAVAERLRDGLRLLSTQHPNDARHATLADVVRWSYDLLSPVEQRVLARLSVFAGGFDLDAAETVAGIALGEPMVVDEAVVSLVDKSLLEHDGRRYRLLEATRQFAHDRLGEFGETQATADVHLAWFVQFVRAAREGLRGAEEATWVERLDVEWANVRAAFRHALELNDPRPAMTLAVALAYEAVVRRPDALGWAEETLTRFGRPADPQLRDLLGAAGCNRWLCDDVAGALALGREGLAQATTPEPDTSSDLLAENATIIGLCYSGQLTDALGLAEVALDRAAARHDPIAEQGMLYTLVIVASMADDRAAVDRAALRAQALETSDNPSTRAIALLTRSFLVDLTNPEEAAALRRAAIAVADSVHNAWIAQIAKGVSLHRSDRAMDIIDGIALVRDHVRKGWLIAAWHTVAWVATALYNRGHPSVAAELLGACRRSPGTATTIDTLFGSLCEALRQMLGPAEYDQLTERGARLDLPGVLRFLDDFAVNAGSTATASVVGLQNPK